MQFKLRRRGRKARRRGPKYWIVAIGAMGMLVAYCPPNSHQVVLGKARLDDGAVTQVQRQITFDIAAGTLESVLISFQKVSGIEVVIPDDAMRTISSPGVTGRYSPDQALREILRGTGISHRFTDRRTVTLEIYAEAESVEVRDDARLSLSSTKYTQPLLDTPQTITVISKEVMEEQ